MIDLKNKLLEFGFCDNEWLSKYLNLLQNAIKGDDMQKHHSIPVCCYGIRNKTNRKENLNKAKLDLDNKIILLSRIDHIKAHYYLCKCANEYLLGPLTSALCFMIYGNANKHCYDDLLKSLQGDMLNVNDILSMICEYHKNRRSLYVMCIETNEVLYIKDAAKKYKRSIDCIKSNVAGKTETCGGYHWARLADKERQFALKEYKNKLPQSQKDINLRKSEKQSKYYIKCIELNLIFDTAVKAGEYIKDLINPTDDYRKFARMILSAASGRYKTAYNYHWIRIEKENN